MELDTDFRLLLAFVIVEFSIPPRISQFSTECNPHGSIEPAYSVQRILEEVDIWL